MVSPRDRKSKEVVSYLGASICFGLRNTLLVCGNTVPSPAYIMHVSACASPNNALSNLNMPLTISLISTVKCFLLLETVNCRQFLFKNVIPIIHIPSIKNRRENIWISFPWRKYIAWYFCKSRRFKAGRDVYFSHIPLIQKRLWDLNMHSCLGLHGGKGLMTQTKVAKILRFRSLFNFP